MTGCKCAKEKLPPPSILQRTTDGGQVAPDYLLRSEGAHDPQPVHGAASGDVRFMALRTSSRRRFLFRVSQVSEISRDGFNARLKSRLRAPQ